MNDPSRRIVVAFRFAGEPGRRKVKGFLRHIAEHKLGWRLQFVRIREDFNADFVRSFTERGIDGVVYSLPDAKVGAEELGRLDIPTVALDIFDDDILGNRVKNLVYINSSCESVGRMAAQYFLAQGLYRSYAFVPDLAGHIWSRLRGEAFTAEMKRNGFNVAMYRTLGKGYDLPKLRAWLEKLPRPAGVFAAFDDRAIQVLEACRDAALDVPHDVAVMGVDNDEQLCPYTTPALTSVQPDHERIGSLAAEKLQEMFAGRILSRPEKIEVGVRDVVVRESTSSVTQAGKLVQHALAFIHAHYTEPIFPKDVVKAMNVSRRLADLRFSEIQGESIGNAILRTRLEAVAHMMISTSNKLEDIAASCGFSRLDRLRSAFIRRYGISMQDYRRLRTTPSD